MKVGLTIWQGRISPVLDVARRLLLVEVVDGQVKARREEPLAGTLPAAQANCLAALAPQVLICGAISQTMSLLLARLPMKIVPFIAGETETVLNAWLRGTLAGPGLSMPGCCRNGRRWCGGGGNGWKRASGQYAGRRGGCGV